MAEISGFPYFEVQFDKSGAAHDPKETQRLLEHVGAGRATDLFVIAHGWNNDLDEARALYRNVFARVRAEIERRKPDVDARTFAVAAILWPSKKFAEADKIASGAASSDRTAALARELDRLTGVFDAPDADAKLQQARMLVPRLASDEAAAVRFIELVRSLPGKASGDDEDASDVFFKTSPRDVANKLSRPDVPGLGGRMPGAGAAPAAAGGAAGIGDWLGELVDSARGALNYTTYYQMKERAGLVGRSGVNRLLGQVRAAAPAIKLHLVGHSFGGRLVTAAADGAENVPVDSVTLLQAAFSHNGFAQRFHQNRDGFFRKVVTHRKVLGPILVTHSVKDDAVGIAYPIASRLSGDDASAFGDAESRYGGIGRNGARHTPEATSFALGPVTSVYAFAPGRIFNLNADHVIQGHSDIEKAEVAHALLSAVAAT